MAAPDHKPPAPQGSPLGRLRRLCDELLNGATPDSALYLTNRTWKQKLRLWLLVSIPIAIVLGVLANAMLTPHRATDPFPTRSSPAQPGFPKDITVAQHTDLHVAEAVLEKSGAGTYIAGTVANSTDRNFAGAELTFDLTDEAGSQVASASTHVGVIAPRAAVRFRVPVPQGNAAYVLVREVRGSL